MSLKGKTRGVRTKTCMGIPAIQPEVSNERFKRRNREPGKEHPREEERKRARDPHRFKEGKLDG
jgi:hypothetical protein